MLELEEAQRRILATLSVTPAESVSVAEVAGRILRQDIRSQLDLPPFDNSAMDGYALRAGDISEATPDNPVTLRVVGESAAGKCIDAEVQPGTCIRIFTGSPLPRGADAVVMQEDTSTASSPPGQVAIHDKVRPWENVRTAGEDVRTGDILFKSGQRIGAAGSGLIAAIGVGQVRVAKRPVIGLLATGDELCEPGQPLARGQIYESNRTMLAVLVRQAGGEPLILPIVRDDLDATREAIKQAMATCDALITSGGASVGDHDYVKAACTGMGGALDFWRVAIKPGKPFLFGQALGNPLFGLPGNPVSAFVTFLVLVRPALFWLLGDASPSLGGYAGELAEPVANHGDRRHLMRVRLDAEGKVRPVRLQSSHALGSLASANGLVDVPPETTFTAGTKVTVLTWD